MPEPMDEADGEALCSDVRARDRLPSIVYRRLVSMDMHPCDHPSKLTVSLRFALARISSAFALNDTVEFLFWSPTPVP